MSGGGVKKYSKRYLPPYILTGLIILVVIVIWSYLPIGKEINLRVELRNLAVAVTFGSGWSGSWGPDMRPERFSELPMIGAIWFLLALFWACVTYSWLKKVFKGIVLLGTSLLSFAVAIYTIKVIRLPFSIQAGMAAVLFLYIGDQLRRYEAVNIIRGFKWYEHAPFLGIWALCILRNYMQSSTCYYPDLTVAGGVIGACYLLLLCERLNIKGGWLGSHTLEILCGNAIVLYIKMFIFNITYITPFALANFVIEFLVDASLSIGIGYLIYKTKILKLV